MAADTPNLGLKRPDLADYFHLQNHLNGNWDLIDAFAGESGFPTGIIVMWSGLLSAIPDGFALCDGAGGTPDLREKFILGWSAGVDPGDTGGQNNVTLVVDNLPAHTHGAGTLEAASNGAHTHGVGTFVTGSDGGHTHVWRIAQGSGGSYTATFSFVTNGNFWSNQPNNILSVGGHTHTLSGSTASGGAHTHTITGSTASVGSGTSFDNRPAFYKLALIIKT